MISKAAWPNAHRTSTRVCRGGAWVPSLENGGYTPGGGPRRPFLQDPPPPTGFKITRQPSPSHSEVIRTSANRLVDRRVDHFHTVSIFLLFTTLYGGHPVRHHPC
jgi:hypothetical protein